MTRLLHRLALLFNTKSQRVIHSLASQYAGISQHTLAVNLVLKSSVYHMFTVKKQKNKRKQSINQPAGLAEKQAVPSFNERSLR